MEDIFQRLIELGPMVGLLFYLYWQRDRDYRELTKRYRDDLRYWAKLEVEEKNGDVE